MASLARPVSAFDCTVWASRTVDQTGSGYVALSAFSSYSRSHWTLCARCVALPLPQSKENIKVWRKRVTEFLLSQGLVKGHAGCGLRPGNAADASLTLDDMRRDLDAPQSMSGNYGPDSDGETQDPEAPRPVPFAAMFEQPHSLTLPPLHNVPPEPENPQYIPNIPKRFEDAIGGIGVDDETRRRWVPPPPFGPPLKKYEDDPEKYGSPPANVNVPPTASLSVLPRCSS